MKQNNPITLMQPITFEQYLQGKGLSEGVIKRYRAEMRRHRQFLHLLGKSPECATKKRSFGLPPKRGTTNK